MNQEDFLRWLNRIYATLDSEIDCEQLQAMLPNYVEAALSGGETAARFAAIHAHLAQCPECGQVYRGLREVVAVEAQGRLPQVDDLLSKFETEAARTSELA